MSNIHYSWFSTTPINEIQINIPTDIKYIIDKGTSISRLSHPEYPTNVFFDNVTAHIYRLVKKASSLEIDGDSKANLIRMLWIHDAPEIYIETERDVTSVEKDSNPELFKAVSNMEDIIAEKILNHDDQNLYNQFEKSKDALKTGIMNDKTTYIGLIAKILDITDGNMSFHYFLSQWIKSNDYKENELPPTSALTYTFRYTELTRNNINNLNLIDKERLLLLGLLEEQIIYIKYLWSGVEPEKVPIDIKTGLRINDK